MYTNFEGLNQQDFKMVFGDLDFHDICNFKHYTVLLLGVWLLSNNRKLLGLGESKWYHLVVATKPVHNESFPKGQKSTFHCLLLTETKQFSNLECWPKCSHCLATAPEGHWGLLLKLQVLCSLSVVFSPSDISHFSANLRKFSRLVERSILSSLWISILRSGWPVIRTYKWGSMILPLIAAAARSIPPPTSSKR